MPANLIKLLTNGTTTLFSPDKVALIQLPLGSDKISIVLTTGRTVELLTPSPADAIVKLAQLETAMNTATGLVTVNDQNTATTTTTTAGPSAPTGPGSGSPGPSA